MHYHGFFPPLHLQRRKKIYEILEEATDIKSLLDIGCSQGQLLSYLVTCNDKVPIEYLAGFDINEGVLNSAEQGIAINDKERLRWRPLTAELYQGDIKQLHSFRYVDAVVASEFIEHLSPEEIHSMEELVFNVIQPRFFIVSTPNSEFNPLLRMISPKTVNGTRSRRNGFRHDDHLFEWTRSEFQKWAHQLCEQYSNYTCDFTGVGFAYELFGDKTELNKATDSHDFGPCSSFTIFKRTSLRFHEQRKQSPCNGIRLFARVVHPFVNRPYPPSYADFNKLLNLAIKNDYFGFEKESIQQLTCKLNIEIPLHYFWNRCPILRHAFRYNEATFVAYFLQKRKMIMNYANRCDTKTYRIRKVSLKQCSFTMAVPSGCEL
ncbi:S-adenosylmethionine-dependentmethyltransferase [Schizosaccharomyces japonicus yFS275]|uniref:Small RNA 2'-O-methyltransferase n=1 Tax=Schizosaccharomyces japonicus (strain yFS275 / FY16936) TaxID=402676 RepID=B6K194_SCHJY|nr:S-adenosylmethionine-dependentmethyltransferase [Schizosaccharomyces japonicus yFS275]EEB07715.1 S-adenosylmethionine-dependentmethyltransferase [Schizosaccharomyces japonicus yFS275]